MFIIIKYSLVDVQKAVKSVSDFYLFHYRSMCQIMFHDVLNEGNVIGMCMLQERTEDFEVAGLVDRPL